MELYTLTSRFLPKESVGEFTSAIWTERYSSAGDVQLVVPPVPSMIEKLAPGTFLGLRGTSEIMQLKSHSIENDLLTVVGSSMPDYLNQRQAWFANAAYDGTEVTTPLAAERSEDTTAGQLISSVVYNTVISPTAFGSYWAPINLDWESDKIPGLALGRVDANGTVKRLSFPLGPLYEGIAKLAQDEGVGIKLYLESASYSSGFVFKFATYRGKDRTSEQTIRTMVRLTPKMDSLNDVKEIHSVEAYKNVFYVNYKNAVSTHYIPGLAVPTGFNRRDILVDAPDIFLLPEHIAAFREQVARNTIANHIYIQAVDGRVSSKIPYDYGIDYSLGDVIELQGYTGVYSKARIVEYIRSQDQFGEQEYPTLAVLDPLFIGYMPDLEPEDPDWPWEDDPDFDLDLDEDPDADPEIHRKRRKRHPLDPVDPNPDPEPNFTPPPPDISLIGVLVLGAYPDQNRGEAMAILKLDGTLIPNVWVYETQNPTPDDNYPELIPEDWTLDHQRIIVRSIDRKDTATPELPWTQGHSWWSTDGIVHDRLTDTIPNTSFKIPPLDGPLGPGYRWKPPGAVWFGGVDIGIHAAEDRHLYIAREKYFPAEAVYADGYYTEDQEATGHGDKMYADGALQELFVSWDGHIEPSATVSLLGPEDFPPHSRWSPFLNLTPSPNGNKLAFSRYQQGPTSSWSLSSITGLATSGTFTLTVGSFGNAVSAYYTTDPIPYNANAETIFNALALLPNLEDPRLTGYPGIPYGGTNVGSSVTLLFKALPPLGCWMSSHSDDLVFGFDGAYTVHTSYGVIPNSSAYYICDHDGDNLEEADIGSRVNSLGGWSPDSTKLHGLTDSPDGDPNFRWFNYDVATGVVTHPLDYTGVIDPVDGSGPMVDMPVYSPDGTKIAFYIREEDGTKTLFVADADGTGAVELYHQTVEDFTTDPDSLVLSRMIVWNIQNTKLAIVDSRNEAPVWTINVADGIGEKIWPGSGWTDSDEQIWLFDPLTFDDGT